MTLAEIVRLNNARGRVLRLLQARGERGAFNHELCAPDVGGNRGIGRVDELRAELEAQGWTVAKEHVARGTWRYWLTARADDGQPRLF